MGFVAPILPSQSNIVANRSMEDSWSIPSVASHLQLCHLTELGHSTLVGVREKKKRAGATANNFRVSNVDGDDKCLQ